MYNPIWQMQGDYVRCPYCGTYVKPTDIAKCPNCNGKLELETKVTENLYFCSPEEVPIMPESTMHPIDIRPIGPFEPTAWDMVIGSNKLNDYAQTSAKQPEFLTTVNLEETNKDLIEHPGCIIAWFLFFLTLAVGGVILAFQNLPV